jgi:hypothetical protein
MFYSTLTIAAPKRDEEIKRLKEAGPGRVSVTTITPLPNGFLAMRLVHVNKRGERMGYTTLVAYPAGDGPFIVD